MGESKQNIRSSGGVKVSPGKGSSFFHIHTPMPAQVLFSEQKYSLAQVILLRIACGVCGVTGIWGRSNDQKPLALLTVNCMYLVCSPRSRTFPADDTGSASSPVCDVPALKPVSNYNTGTYVEGLAWLLSGGANKGVCYDIYQIKEEEEDRGRSNGRSSRIFNRS